MSRDLPVSRSVTIPAQELDFAFSTSGGPGGQHANKAATRVELVWNVRDSVALGPRQKQRVLGALRKRIDSSGRLRLTSDTHRSQSRNRDEVLSRLQTLVRDALRVPKQRLPTKPTPQSQERRLDEKRRRSRTKRLRRPTAED